MGTQFGGGRGIRRKNERDRLLFVAAAGAAFSLLVLMLVVLNYQSDASAGNQISPTAIVPPSVGTTVLYVPERAVRAGEKLANIPLKETNWPRNNVPDRAVIDRSEMKDLYAKVDLPAGIPLTRDAMTEQPSQATLPVTPGNRAITIDVDATTGLEGLALPGTRVDVTLTYNEGTELTSKIIVQNARVISSGGNTQTVSERSAVDRAVASAAKTVTLDVSSSDALKIATAKQMGKLSLFMRASEDTAMVPVPDFGGKDFGIHRKSEPKSVSNCSSGRIKVNGRDYQLNCDGSKVAIQDADPTR